MAAESILKWNAAQSADTYDVQVSEVEGSWSPTNLVVDESALSSTQLDVGDVLEHDVQYYWRVRGANKAGSGDWSAVWAFTAFAAPAAFSLSVPEPGATIDSSTTTLSWAASERAESYVIELSASPDFSSSVQEFTTDQTSYEITELSPGQTYHWRVKAVNRGGEYAWAGPRAFTMQSLPEKVTLVAPSNESDVTVQ